MSDTPDVLVVVKTALALQDEWRKSWHDKSWPDSAPPDRAFSAQSVGTIEGWLRALAERCERAEARCNITQRHRAEDAASHLDELILLRQRADTAEARVALLETELSNSIHEHGQSSGFWGRAASREVDLRKQAEERLRVLADASVAECARLRALVREVAHGCYIDQEDAECIAVQVYRATWAACQREARDA